MILYGSTMSPFVRKVAAYAAEKGIDQDTALVQGLAEKSKEFVEKGAEVYSQA